MEGGLSNTLFLSFWGCCESSAYVCVLQPCSKGPNPEACVACLTAAVRDDVKADLCDNCASTNSPWECNECLTSAIDDDVSVEVVQHG